jgi:hypothetical protein
MKKFSVVFFTLFALAVLGCATAPVLNTFMDPMLSAREHAVLILDRKVAVPYIDNTFNRKAVSMILLIPGHHTLMAQYVDKSMDIHYDNSIEFSTTYSDHIRISRNFLAGHVYHLNPVVNGNRVAINIVEESDSSIWETKFLTSASPSNKILPSAVTYRAAQAAPSLFEGTWTLKDIGSALAQQQVLAVEYSFTGQSYSMWVSAPVGIQAIQFINAVRPSWAAVSAPLYAIQRGTFNVIENTVTFNFIQSAFANNLDNALWADNPRAIETTYEFAFNNEGNLVLTFKSGNKAKHFISSAQDPIILVKKE